MDMVRRHSHGKGSRGFTLIELVVAILVFALGITGIMKMHQASVQSNNFSMQLSQAMNVAEDKMDYLRGLGLNNNSMSVGAHNTPDVVAMGVPYTITWTVVNTPNTFNRSRTVSMRITWQQKALGHRFDLQSIMN
jgi:prepilin-type N-terminal cleavage/methylation domain-containing protein